MSAKTEFTKQCEKYGINKKVAQRYRREHKHLTEEQVITHYIQPKEKTITEKARDAGISVTTLVYHHKKHKDIEIDELIRMYKAGELVNSKVEKEQRETVYDRCKRLGISYATYRDEIKKGLSDEEAIEKARERRSLHEEKSLSARYRKRIKEEGLTQALQTVMGYHYRNPELSDDEVFAYFHKEKELSFRQKLEKANLDISYPRAIYYKNENPNLSEEDVIDLIRKKLETRSFVDKCRDAGLSDKKIIACQAYRTKHKELSDEEIIQIYTEKGDGISFKARCIEDGITYSRAKYIKRKYPHLTYEKVKDYVLDNEAFMQYENRGKTTAELCREYDVSYDEVIKYRKRYKGLSNEEAVKATIEYLNKPKEKTRTQICEELGTSLSTIYSYMYRHEVSFEVALEMWKANQGKETFSSLCRKYGIDNKKACTYRCDHRPITDVEVILHYRPDLRVNIFGEIVEK